jgi:hypothetical protein
VPRLNNYVAEDPQSRVPIVERLVSEKADGRKFHQLMELTALPDDVALKIADVFEDTSVTGTIVSRLKSWQSGGNFAAMLSKHVRDGGEISSQTIDQIEALAKKTQSNRSFPAIAYASSPDNHGVENSRRTNRLEPSGKNSDVVGDAAAMVALSAKKIDVAVPRDKTIVLLGRDTWPLAPVLKAQGRDVQYFMWSRLQLNDQATRAQWLKEVPPHAVVIDTGFNGSILNAIKTIDPSAQGLVIQSNGQYPQLLPYGGQSVFELEKFPKLIGRSETYTPNGGAVSRQNLRDDDEYAPRGNRDYRWDVEKNNSHLLRVLGLPEWDVWRYRRYTGLTPQERLFSDTPEQVAKRYDEVRRLRHLDSQK